MLSLVFVAASALNAPLAMTRVRVGFVPSDATRVSSVAMYEGFWEKKEFVEAQGKAKPAVAKRAAVRAPVRSKPAVAPATTSKALGNKGFWEQPEFIKKQKKQARINQRAMTPRSTPRPSAKYTPSSLPAVQATGDLSPAKAFEANFAPIYVPSREAKRRGDLKQLNDVSRAKAFEKTFAEVYVPPREAKRRPDLAATRDKRKGTFTPSK